MIRILVAEDDADVRFLLRLVLREVGEVVEVADGAAALEALQAGGYDLALLDVGLPRLDGWEVLTALGTPSIPILLVTGRVETEVADRAAALGAAGTVVKPFDIAELRASAQRLLGRDQ